MSRDCGEERGEGPRVTGNVWDLPCLGLISRFLSLGLSGFGGSPPFLPFPPEMETFFLASSLTGLRILADPPGDPAASSGVEPQPPWSLCGFSAVRGAAGEAPGQTPRHTEGPP